MIRPPHVRDGRFEIVVEAGGRLPLPAELVQTLGLEPGDIVALKPVASSWRVRFYRQVLTFPWEEAAPLARWWFTAELLRLPLTALDESGAIVIPPEVLRTSAGDRMVLRVTALFGSSWPDVYLTSRPW
jgi:bifunctional DNA-binding transcriptional regulator/antitoxin component of YhaV-PrlF toxin-antitoxin module